MTVKLNNLALTALLESSEGPVGLLVQRKASEVAAIAKANAATIMERFPQAADAVDSVPGDSNSSVIGIRDQGSISQYLAAKAAGNVQARSAELWPEDGWLVAALRDVFGS